MKSKHELKLIDESIQAYLNMIKFIRKQILDLQRKKQGVVEEECEQCYSYKFKIAKVRKTRVDYCEVCECTPCDCDYGNDEENMWKMWGDI